MIQDGPRMHAMCKLAHYRVRDMAIVLLASACVRSVTKEPAVMFYTHAESIPQCLALDTVRARE